MKLTRVLAWIGVAAACVAVAIAEAPPITGVEARLRIRSLRAPQGPGIELLEYLTPRTGRNIPEDARANDLAHWETVVNQDDMNATWTYLSASHEKLISSGVEKSGERTAFLFADPDGHVIEAVSPRNTQALNVQGR